MIAHAPLSRRLFAALAAGFTVGATAFVSMVLAVYIASGAAAAQFAPIALYFSGAAIILVVLVAIAALVGGLGGWRRVVVGIIAAIASAFVWALIEVLMAGGSANAGSLAGATLAGYYLPYMVVALIATLTLAPRAYRWALAAKLEDATDLRRTALVRAPVATLSKGLVTHVKRKRVVFATAEKQWDDYVAALEAEGFTTIEVEPAEAHPDSVFIEDTVVMLGQVAVLTSPGAESRRGEPDAVADTVRELGLEQRQIRLPGTLDGGDVLKIGTTVYIGRGGRTNGEGIRQFREIAGGLGYTVIAVPVTKALHLKSAVTALPDGTVIGHESLVDNPDVFDRYLEVPEVEGVAVVVLSPSAVLMSASAPLTKTLLEDLGYRVVTVTITEFEKLEGCVTCLSVRIR